ncbi:MAG: phage baseplate assembly protein V [Candidatus Brocadiaceae bacterium]
MLENDPDGEDRIKVRLPLISDAEEGIWAVSPHWMQEKGVARFFRPEIGDEVVVGFLNDDPRHPVVLGMCHSSAKPAPEPAKDDNHRKGYVSREKMEFIFDDEKKSYRAWNSEETKSPCQKKTRPSSLKIKMGIK